jgi:hypothetical protein|tara:strand:+ start:1280 stop:1438 length:159 start_codon:yes stop_codon:yes gene_type:complete
VAGTREGADLEAKDHKGKTPLDEAVKRDENKIGDIIRKHGGKTGKELEAEGK